MNITLRLEDFLKAFFYFRGSFTHEQIPQEVADAIKLADPNGELTYLEPIVGQVFPFNLWTKQGWINECERRKYINDLNMQRETNPAKRAILHQIKLAKFAGDFAKVSQLQSILSVL